MEKKDYYTPQELAKIAGAHHVTILRNIKDGLLKADNIGGRYVIMKADAKKWIEAHQNHKDGRRVKIKNSKL